MVDKNGQNPKYIRYKPYGAVQQADDPHITKYQYTGQENDGDTGLYYYNARYYDPDLCRFIQADSVLDGLNRYAYCANNPIRYTDPTGTIKLDGDQLSFIYSILGPIGERANTGVDIVGLGNNNAVSLPNGLIGVPAYSYNNTTTNYSSINDFIHEAFHQVQYFLDPILTCETKLGNLSVFENLLIEQFQYQTGEDVYAPGDYTKSDTDLSQYKTLNDMPYFESQAQMVGMFAQLYMMARNGEDLDDIDKTALMEMTRILVNTGLKSEATEWVSKNIGKIDGQQSQNNRAGGYDPRYGDGNLGDWEP
ncbi:MAG: RHS repeat-associated core domain-containing protein [Spirochaetales bacterium]|nr:RHS repeat-associated core domain-containing protein [Spirochaetales bacterium]